MNSINLDKQKIIEFIDGICETTVYRDFENNITYSQNDMPEGETADLPTLTTWEIAEKFLKYLGVEENVEIEEIPLCWNNAVVIRFAVTKENSKSPILFSMYADYEENNKTQVILYIENDYPYREIEMIPCISSDIGIKVFELQFA